MFFVLLISGLFLGWSLGANDAANVYGTAVGTRMIKFRTAAIACSLFVILGAVVGGAGAAHTLGKLGAVNALAGSFTVALAAAVTVTWMTKAKLPVSTSQAVVGAIIGWNFFSGSLTDLHSLTKIVSSWVLCPVLAAVFSIGMFKAAGAVMNHTRLHLFTIDRMTRNGLFLVGAFASYSLGANNIANVMGVFVPASPFGDLNVLGLFTLSGAQQLFFLGGVAIAVGVFTYSKKVMLTVGNDLFKLSPIAALIVVLAQAVVLFLFSSEPLENWLASHGLPTIPLVPVSSSQAVIGAVVGIGLAKGGRNIQFKVLGKIASGWLSTPVISCVLAFVLLFIVQNVFSQRVYDPVRYELSYELASQLQRDGRFDERVQALVGQRFERAADFKRALAAAAPGLERSEIIRMGRVRPLVVDIHKLDKQLDYHWFAEDQVLAVFRLHGRRFQHGWQLADALAGLSPGWRTLPSSKTSKLHNKELRAKLQHLYRIFEAREPALGAP